MTGLAADFETDMSDEQRSRREALDREEQRRDMAALLDTPFGRNVLWRILHQCQVYGTSYGGDGHAAFTDGRRFVGVQLIALIQQVSPTAYADLLREMTLRDYERRQVSEASQTVDEGTNEEGAQ